MPNRLANESSPYLLQHKDNPVDWWPWGEAAFDEARRRDVPVFLSVGYSTCYWCHVMEREVFENAALARQMNEGFVCVKVDREQRPDVDEHYMTATQVLAGQGGWPMSVFLTPGGEPFFAGTYFPPTDMPGRPGFGRLMESISEAWRERRSELTSTIEDLDRVLGQLSRPKPSREDVTFDDDLLVQLVNEAARDFDAAHGGFGGSPKFPQQTLLQLLLLAQHTYAKDNEGWEHQIRTTLDAMANGGIRDHLGGGFHRYSTDAEWLVPHFEIMLYDQALLAWVYVEAYRQFEDRRYAAVARRCLDFVLREMTHGDGAFFTALDAEAEAKEGGPYVWTPEQVVEVLGETDGRRFNAAYGLSEGFNFADPHGPTPHRQDANVLFLARPEAEEEPELEEMRQKLLLARKRRPQPLLDTKVITSWNGLMIQALAHAADVLQERGYREAAARAASWLLRHHKQGDRLLRSSRDGKTDPSEGTLEDYAHLARGCLALWEAGGDEAWQDHAAALAVQLEVRFEDDALGGYYNTAEADASPASLGGRRRCSAGDNPLPSGNGSAALLMLELDRADQARQVIEPFAGQLRDYPQSSATLLMAAIRFREREGDFVVRGQRDAAPQSVAEEADAAVEVGAAWAGPRDIVLKLAVADGFHLYAPNHAGPESAVEVAGPEVASVDFPAPGDGRLTGGVELPITLSSDATEQGVELSLAYQACDATRCLTPVRKTFRVRPPLAAE